jgi:peptidoglycan-associated lipoprotein
MQQRGPPLENRMRSLQRGGHDVQEARGPHNRRISAAFAWALVAALAACGGPSYPKCNNDDDCNKDGHKGVCIDGTCQECGKDSDCQQGFVCQHNRCVPKPECTADADCPPHKACKAGKCVLECSQDADCAGGLVCKDNRCVKPECTVDSDCGTNGKCLQGKCASPTGACMLESVHFAYNESALDDTAKQVLQKNVECMKSRPPTGKVVASGNADERGTEEYNLHLAQRRADAAAKYTVNLGISKNQLKTISYGKDKPICTESNEGCWGQNRRVDFTE